MANTKFNARHGLSVGTTPVDVVDNAGEVLTNAASATKLKTSRTISLTGNITGSVGFDGTQNASITTTLDPNANKSFTDNVTFFQDNTDNTKKMVFELSGIAASTTRTITIPDANLTLVGLDTTQTLTNKTLTSPVITGGSINNTPIGSTTVNSGAFTTLTANAATTLTANTASNNTTTGTLVVTGGVGISGALNIGTNLAIGGNVTSGAWQGSLISSTYGGTGINNAGRTLTISTGNLTFTAQAAGSSVTVPATGTLATLAGTESLTNKTLGATTIAGNLVPDTDVTYNLGSATKRFKDLFLSGTTINLGNATLSSSASSVTLSALDNTPIGGTTRNTAAFTTLAANDTVTFTKNTGSTSTTTGTLIVTGGVGISENLYVGGNLVINGTTTTVNSTTVSVDDPIFTLGGDTAPVADDTKDRGIEFRWYDTQARTGFFGFDRSSGKFIFIPNATNTAEVFSGTKGTIDANLEWADILNKPSPVVTVTLTGDVTGTANATLTEAGNGTITVSTTISANSVALGTDTTGNYLLDISAGTGISVSHTQGEGSTATVSIDNTVVTLTGSQTLTNKTLTDSTTNFQDETDNTKKMQFQLSGITANTTRTLSVPNQSGTIAVTSDINDGTLSISAITAGATNTTVDLNLSGAYSANTSNNRTINAVVGPALTALSSIMTGATTGLLKKTAADTYVLDTTAYITSASIGDGTLSIGTATAGATNTTVALNLSGAYSANTTNNRTINAVVGPALTNLATLMTTAGAGFIRRGATADTYSIDTNTYATTASIGDGTLSIGTATAGATNTTVALNLSGAYSANTSNNRTINAVVGPALTNLATLMTTAGAGFIRRGATADTYSIDTNTYLTAEADTLSTVTGRGASTSTAVSLNGGLSTNIIKQSYTTATYSGTPATYSMDTNTAGSWYITLQANIILSFTNIASNIGSSGYVFLKQDATGGRSFTLSSEIKTPGGRTFTQTTTANSLSMITYFVADASSVVINYIADFK